MIRQAAARLYRPQILEAYRVAPRGLTTAPDFDRFQPRWCWCWLGSFVVALLVGAGLVVQVPIGPAGVVAGHNGDRVVLALPNYSAPASGTEITFAASGRTVRGTVLKSKAGSGVDVTMVLVRLRSASGGDLAEGAQAAVDEGQRSLFLDLTGVGR